MGTHPYVLFLISSWHLRTLQPGTLVLFPVYISSLSLLKVNNLIQTQTSCTTHANIPLLSLYIYHLFGNELTRLEISSLNLTTCGALLRPFLSVTVIMGLDTWRPYDQRHQVVCFV